MSVMQTAMTKLATLSLAARQTALFALIMVVVITGLGWFVETAIRHHFKVGDSAELEAIIDRVEMTLSQGSDNLAQRFDDILIGHHHPLLRVSRNDELIYLSDESAADLLRWQGNTGLEDSEQISHEHHYRLRYQTLETDNGQLFQITVAIGIDHHLSFLRQFNTTLWLILLAAIALSTALAWLAIRYSLRPLSSIIKELQTVSATQLKRQLNTDAMPTELVQLCSSLNAMMLRIDTSFQRLSDYSSDIAHELRTPVTALMTQTQVALSAARNAAEYREVLYSSMEELERMRQMIADMLFLAQTENSEQLPDIENINIRNEINNLIEFYEILSEEKNIQLNCDGDASVMANRLMLRRAIGNLLSNAIKHAPEGSKVNIRLTSQADKVLISVQNPGKVIPDSAINKVFDRFYRNRDTENQGTGLGLAIVKSIAEAHGGEIHVSSAENSTSFTLYLPHRR